MLHEVSEMETIRHYRSRAPVDVVKAIRALNIDYAERPMSPEQSGYISKQHGHYVITVNSNDGEQRRRFTAAHELGHYVLHRDMLGEGRHLDRLYGQFASSNPYEPFSPSHEVQANQFAADFLMPSSLVLNQWHKLRDISEIARQFKVSKAAAEIRLKTLGLTQ